MLILYEKIIDTTRKHLYIMIIAITCKGSVIRTPIEEFTVQNSEDFSSFNRYYADGVRVVQQASLEDTLLLFTESGTCFKVNVKDIPCTTALNYDASYHDIYSINTPFCSILPTKELFNGSRIDDYFVVIVTRSCKIVKQKLSDYRTIENGCIAISLEPNDAIASVTLARENDIISNCVHSGRGRMFCIDTVRPTLLKTQSKGRSCFYAIRNEKTVFIDATNNVHSGCLIVTQNGYAIKIRDGIVNERMGGCISLIRLKDSDIVLFSSFINDTEDILIVTHKGYVARFSICSLSEQYRGGVGKKCINLAEDDKIVACCKVLPKM